MPSPEETNRAATIGEPMITVDKSVPVPPVRWSTEAIYPWHTMAVGDSFLVPFEQATSPARLQTRLAACWTRFKPQGLRFTSRMTPEGVRVWRTA